jgi:hypothetical protein
MLLPPVSTIQRRMLSLALLTCTSSRRLFNNDINITQENGPRLPIVRNDVRQSRLHHRRCILWSPQGKGR